MYNNIVLHAMWFILGLLHPVDMAKLVDSWDETNPNQVERAFCANVHLGTYHNKNDPKDLTNGQVLLQVTEGSLRPAEVVKGSVNDDSHITPSCPDNDSTILIHTHTPTTCEDGHGCTIGGGDAYQCLPSDVDLVWTAQRVLHIGGVQCDKHAIVFFNPVIKGPPSKNRAKRVDLTVPASQHRTIHGSPAKRG